MKILYWSDPHLRGKSPIHRKDDFHASILAKLEEVFGIAKEEKIDRMICGADIFHSPVVSLNICDDFIDLVEKYGIPVDTLIGNHDMYNCNWSVSSSTTLAHCFRRSNLINHLDEIDTPTAYIKGVDYSFNVEEDLEKDLFINPNLRKDRTNILVVHAMIVGHSLPQQVSHILYKDIKSNYNYIFVGHNHHEFGVKKVGESKVVGIGAICRLTISKNDCERIPKVFILDTVTREEKIIELTSVKPKEEVFDFDKIKEIKKFNNTIEKFMASLQDAKVQGIEVRGVVKALGKKHKIEQEVIDCVLTRIGMYEDKN